MMNYAGVPLKKLDTENKMHKKKIATSYANRLAWTLIGVTLIMLVLHLLLQYLNLVVYQEQNGFVFELSNRLDLDDEISVPTWYSQILLFTIGIGAFLAAYLQNRQASRRLWVIIGCLGLLLSIDEAASLHELVLQSLHNMYFLDTFPTVSRNAWWLITPLIVLPAGLLIWQAIKLLPKRTALFFILGGVLAVIGGTIVDAVAVIVPTTTFLYQGILVGFEEGLELLGSTIVLFAIADYIETRYHERLHKAVKQLKSVRK